MYIMYIDESGDTITLSQKGKHFLVLTGAVIHEKDKVAIEKSFRDIKKEYYQDPDVEIKSNYLRYANPDLKESSPIKLKDRKRYDELEADMAKFLKNIPVSLISAVINKPAYWKKYPSQNPYNTAYIFLLEGLQEYLSNNNELGVCIIDPREGQVEKSFIGEELDRVHHKVRWEESDSWQKSPNIIERILFATSDRTVGIQIADLFCYPIFHIFEYNKRKDEYWRFKELTQPKLVELKFFPEESKKDFNYFS
jgi:hypothetical protein